MSVGRPARVCRAGLPALGQGQEPVAEAAMEQCFKHGGWSMLANLHLVAKWLLKLEKILGPGPVTR